MYGHWEQPSLIKSVAIRLLRIRPKQAGLGYRKLCSPRARLSWRGWVLDGFLGRDSKVNAAKNSVGEQLVSTSEADGGDKTCPTENGVSD